MTIRANCPQCGRVYRLADDAVGKKAKCKSCDMPFDVRPLPAPQTGSQAESQPSTPTKPCPDCDEPMSTEAVICVQCGYDKRTRRKIFQTPPGWVEVELGCCHLTSAPTIDVRGSQMYEVHHYAKNPKQVIHRPERGTETTTLRCSHCGKPVELEIDGWHKVLAGKEKERIHDLYTFIVWSVAVLAAILAAVITYFSTQGGFRFGGSLMLFFLVLLFGGAGMQAMVGEKPWYFDVRIKGAGEGFESKSDYPHRILRADWNMTLDENGTVNSS